EDQNGAGPIHTTKLRDQSGWEATPDRSQDQRLRSEAIDEAIDSLVDTQSMSSRSLHPITLGMTVTEHPTPVSENVDHEGGSEPIRSVDADPKGIEIHVSRAVTVLAISAAAAIRRWRKRLNHERGPDRECSGRLRRPLRIKK